MLAAIPSSGGFHNVEAVLLKKRILKLRWIGMEEEANRLLRDLDELAPFEIVPMGVSETD